MRRQATRPVEVASTGDFSLITLSGSIDEKFRGFGALGDCQVAVIDVSAIERISSFGVRQWLAAMAELPKSLTDVYLLGCNTCIVDQLNMVLNFGGPAKVLTILAPFVCPRCHSEAALPIDVLSERASLARGEVPHRKCQRCEAALELDEAPESFFTFLPKYGATRLHAHAAQMLAVLGRYKVESPQVDVPPRVLKIVHGEVTYFHITGVIGATFKARPFLVGAEGEIVLDLAEVEHVDASGISEWKRLLKNLTGLVPQVTVVDIRDTALALIGDSLAMPRVALATVSVPFKCSGCGKLARESVPFAKLMGAKRAEPQVCGTCGSSAVPLLQDTVLPPLKRVASEIPPASAQLIGERDEIRSRAVADANVANATGASRESDPDIVLGKYKVLRRLSEGGMADIFLATQVGIDKPVAIKRIQHKLLEARQKAIELFLNEAKISGRLAHPNIVQVLDVGEDRGALFLAMEYVHGRDLRTMMRKLRQQRLPLPLGPACHIIREVARALDFAYWSTDMNDKQMAVVHRDVTPHNIMLGFDGTVKLLDFGVAMSGVTTNQANMIVGKWLYMSPEATAQLPLDHRSDLFSLGIVLYYACAGVTPFGGASPTEIVTAIRSGTFEALWRVAPNVPRSLSSLCDRMLALDPRNRPQRGQDIVRELTDIMRAENIECAGPDLARFLTQAFPQDAAQLGARSKIHEIVHVSGSDMTIKDAGTPTFTPDQIIDQSESLLARPARARSAEDSQQLRARTPAEETQQLRAAPPRSSWLWIAAVIAFAVLVVTVIVLR